MSSHLPLVFGFVLTLAFILLLVTFRSIVVPIKAIVLNLLSVGAAYGILKLVFQDGRLEGVLDYQSVGGITSWLPLFLFVILFGLSMDYHVFILSRVREAVDRGHAHGPAVAHGIKSTAGVVTSAAAVMVAVFAIFATLSMLEFKQMGVGLAVAILIDATLVRAVLLPGDDEAPRRPQLVPAEGAAAGCRSSTTSRRWPVGRPRRHSRPYAAARMRMRAAVLEEFGKPLVVQELELDEPKGHEVLVRLVACGVCHTDLYTASGVDPSGYAPCVLGHEGAGVVERVGADVTLVAPGDHVVTHFSPQCGECVHCRSPKTNLCLAIREQQNAGYLPDGTTRLSRDGERIRHFMGTSTFAEYTVMPEIALSKVNPEAPLEGAALFACGLSTGLGAAMQTAKVEAGLDLRRVRRRHGRPRRGRRLPPAGRGADHRRRPVRGPAGARARPGRDRRAGRRRGHRRVDPRADRRVRGRLHVRGDRQRRRSCARRSSPRAWAGACARSPAWPARARRSTSSRAS